MHSTYPEVRALPSKNKTANPPMYVVFPFCWRFFPPHGCIFVYRLGFYCFYFLITRSILIFFTKNLSVANAGNSIYPIFSSRGKGISGPSVCQRSATLRTKLGNPDINLEPFCLRSCPINRFCRVQPCLFTILTGYSPLKTHNVF